jgi:hypothetical protein
LALFNRDIPETKKIKPRMANIQGFCLVIFSPKIPNIPMISPAIPKRINTVLEISLTPILTLISYLNEKRIRELF